MARWVGGAFAEESSISLESEARSLETRPGEAGRDFSEESTLRRIGRTPESRSRRRAGGDFAREFNVAIERSKREPGAAIDNGKNKLM
jgi:hypothetical protein